MVVTIPAPEPATTRRSAAMRNPAFWLVVVGACYLLAMLAFVVAAHPTLGPDESLYASQTNPRVPNFPFSAPRARGITYLIAPVVELTNSTVALRSYLAAVAAVLLVIVYSPWLRILPAPRAVPVAAGVFAGLWTSLFYGSDDMPNLWLALAAVGTVGWFLRYADTRRFRFLVLVALGMAVMTLMRPPDAIWIALPLLAAAVFVRTVRTWTLPLAVLSGIALGLVEWVVEAYRSYGGIGLRLTAANKNEGGIGWHPLGIVYTWRDIAGPRLCRPCKPNGHVLLDPRHLVFSVWWLAIPVLVAAALILAARQGRLLYVALPAACGLAVALTYLFTVNYAAARFLLPTYALLALPVADVLLRIPAAAPTRLRRGAYGLLVAALIVNVAGQVVVLRREVADQDPIHAAVAQLRHVGVSRPCIIAGLHRDELAYRMGCMTGPRDALAANTGRADVAYLTPHSVQTGRIGNWRRAHLTPHVDIPNWYAYVKVRTPAPVPRR